MIKDYYAILQIPPYASIAEVRSAFRRLAMLYHPDKNPGDLLKAAQFSDLREAYDVLTDSTKKENYLQERWYNQSIGKKKTSGTESPVSVLRLSLELERYVSTLDVHRMNKEGLSDYVLKLLSADTIAMLNRFKERDINQQIVTTILTAIKPLPLQSVRLLASTLEKLADDGVSRQRINDFLLGHRKRFLWEKYKVVVIILFTALLCLLIFFTGK